jgi:hypothetical protein
MEMERLLARMDANTKAMRQDMKYMQEKIRTNQEKADAIRKEIMAKIDDNQKRMEASRKTDGEEMNKK